MYVRLGITGRQVLAKFNQVPLYTDKHHDINKTLTNAMCSVE